MEEINEDRADHGKKPFDGTKATEEKAINESTTDPKAECFTKENTRNALHIQHRQVVTKTAM